MTSLVEMLRANGSWEADAAAAKIARLEVALEETGNALLSQIETSSELADRVVKLEAEVLGWQQFANAAKELVSDAVDDCVRATKLAEEKHKQLEAYRELCNKQAQTMAEMSAQIDELAKLAGIATKPTRQ